MRANDLQVNHDQIVRPVKIHSHADRHSLAIRVSQSIDEDSEVAMMMAI